MMLSNRFKNSGLKNALSESINVCSSRTLSSDWNPTFTCFSLGSSVACHNQNGIFEADRSALAVCQTAVLHNLQKHMLDIRVGFFNLIEQHDAVRIAAHFFR